MHIPAAGPPAEPFAPGSSAVMRCTKRVHQQNLTGATPVRAPPGGHGDARPFSPSRDLHEAVHDAFSTLTPHRAAPQQSPLQMPSSSSVGAQVWPQQRVLAFGRDEASLAQEGTQSHQEGSSTEKEGGEHPWPCAELTCITWNVEGTNCCKHWIRTWAIETPSSCRRYQRPSKRPATSL